MAQFGSIQGSVATCSPALPEVTRQATDPPPGSLFEKNGILLLAISRMILDRFPRRKVVLGHAGDVPMHRLPTQLLLSSEIRYFSAGTPSRNSPEFPTPEFRGGGDGHNVYTLNIRKSWDSEQILAQECQESHAE